MGRRQRRATVLRLALVLMASDFQNLTRGPPDSGDFVYECPNKHRQYRRRPSHPPPMCNQKGCGKETKFVPEPEKR